MQFPKRVDKLGSAIFERNDWRKQVYLKASIKNQSPNLIDLSLGSSDLLPPKCALEAISKALNNPESSSYCLHAGTNAFREAVASWAKRRFEVDVDPGTEVLLLIGSQEGTAHLPLAVMNPGQTGLILDPSYPSHRGGLVLADAHIEKLVLKAKSDWKPDFGDLKTSQWEALKLMVFGYPHNPTALVGEQIWLEEAMEQCCKHEVVLAHDNPYVDLAIDGEAPALLQCLGWKKWGIEFFSFSKGWCMGGFRLGFAIGAEKIIKALSVCKSVIDFNQSSALQAGAISALASAGQWPEQILGIYEERRDRTLKALRLMGWDVPLPSMAMYLWMPVPDWAIDQEWNDEIFASELLIETGIAITPGQGFGSGGEGWLRLALVRPVEELEEAVARMTPWWNEHR